MIVFPSGATTAATGKTTWPPTIGRNATGASLRSTLASHRPADAVVGRLYRMDLPSGVHSGALPPDVVSLANAPDAKLSIQTSIVGLPGATKARGGLWGDKRGVAELVVAGITTDCASLRSVQPISASARPDPYASVPPSDNT